jgi:hypothetical protein
MLTSWKTPLPFPAIEGRFHLRSQEEKRFIFAKKSLIWLSCLNPGVWLR